MTTTLAQRQIFMNDIKDSFEALYFNIAHLDNQESIENIVTILYALRIAANTYEEYALQKKVEEVLALMLNHQNEHNAKIVRKLYALVEAMVYPYQKESMLTY